MRILITEDDKGVRDFLKNAFEASCYAVNIAEDGETGSYIARTNEHDVIILDIDLPKKNGFEVCKEIRADGITTPIIMLSVHGEIPTKVKLIDSGADDYLTKPFSFEELLARVKAVIRRPKGIESEVIKINGLVIDCNKNEALYKERALELTRKEYLLLEYLARNKDQVLSRGKIMEHVWDMNADPFSNTIEAHIRNIRKKIGNNEIIKTLSGRGYMLVSK